MINQRVVIVQPYLPAYRVPLFERVVELSAAAGIKCVVAASSPTGAQRLRDDAVTSLRWLRELPIREVRFGGRWLRSYSSTSVTRDADAVVCELAAGAIDTYRHLLRRRGRPVGVLGHVGAYVAAPSRIAQAGETWQLKRADQVFAYTERGRAAAVLRGVRPERVSAFMNTVDTDEIAQAISSLSDADVAAFVRRHGLAGKPVLAYLGSLDASKRIDFLASVLERLKTRMPDVRLLVAGTGEQAQLLNAAVQRGQAILLGRADATTKAYLAHVASLLVNPGRVGLVAVESFVLGLPVVTVGSPFHAPEFDYLNPLHDCIVTPDDATAYAERVVGLLKSPLELARLRGGALAKSGHPRLDASAARLVDGIMRLLVAPGSRG